MAPTKFHRKSTTWMEEEEKNRHFHETELENKYKNAISHHRKGKEKCRNIFGDGLLNWEASRNESGDCACPDGENLHRRKQKLVQKGIMDECISNISFLNGFSISERLLRLKMLKITYVIRNHCLNKCPCGRPRKIWFSIFFEYIGPDGMFVKPKSIILFRSKGTR